MDTSGHIEVMTPEEAEEMVKGDCIKKMPLEEHEARALRKRSLRYRKNWMRNKPCVCGSGKKFKKCCWKKAALQAR